MNESRAAAQGLADVEARIWELRAEGQTLPTIARAVNVSAAVVNKCLSATGGVRPQGRHRSARHLSVLEREEISRGLCAKRALAEIAREIGRPTSTVSREVSRNGGAGAYRAVEAEERARDCARRPKPRKMLSNPRLTAAVYRKLRRKWSPEQVASWLKDEYRHDCSMQASHETIYRTLYVQARGELKKELVSHLRKRHAIRHPKKLAAVRPGAYVIPDLVNISQRPAQAEDRAVPGHWEGDLLCGSKNTQIITLVERRSRYVILIKADSHDTACVVNALTEHVQRLPEGMMLTLTWDQGREMAAHATFSISTDVKVFFCDPRSPWQRGSNENTNGLLRQYFPKYTDLSKFTQGQLDYVAAEMNTRPRQTLGWKTPLTTLMSALR